MSHYFLFTLKNETKIKSTKVNKDDVLKVVSYYSQTKDNLLSSLAVFKRNNEPIRIEFTLDEAEEWTSFVLSNIKDVWYDNDKLVVNKGFTVVYNAFTAEIDYEFEGIEDRIISISNNSELDGYMTEILLFVKKGDIITFNSQIIKSNVINVNIDINNSKSLLSVPMTVRYIYKYVKPSKSY